MLSEFYCIFIFIVPVVLFVLSFSKIMDSRFKDENTMHKAVYSYFMEDECSDKLKCSGSKLELEGVYSIAVRKPSKGLKKLDKGGVNDNSLDEFYKEFEEKIKTASGK